ncbi:MAG: hypothetical protein AAFY42_14800, partial [Pseudomonadota bacterium]
EGGGCDFRGGESKDVAMCTESREGPGEVSLRIDIKLSACCYDSHQCSESMSTFRDAGKEPVVPELGDVLELAFCFRVVDRDFGMIDKPKERIPMPSIVPNDFCKVIIGREAWFDGIHPIAQFVF